MNPPSTELLRAILEDFYDRVFADVMIGFFFEGKDRRRLVEKELELALVMFGGGGGDRGAGDDAVRYTGRPLREAHAAHRIMGGHFARRTQILADTMRDHGMGDAHVRRWLEHTESLRPLITEYSGGDCD